MSLTEPQWENILLEAFLVVNGKAPTIVAEVWNERSE